MTSRERVRAVIEGRVPDSVPRALYDVAIDCYNPSTLEYFEKKAGRHPRDCFRHDLRGISFSRRPRDKEWVRRVRGIRKPEDVRPALASWIPAVETVDALRARVSAVQDAGFACVVGGDVSYFETPFALRGREQFFVDLGYREDWLPVFLDCIAEACLEDVRVSAAAGADLVCVGGDLGSQRGLLISPRLWRELFKPMVKRLVAEVKRVNPETAVFMHTDGKVDELVPDFIEAGVDVLNPIQPEVMDPAEMKRRYGDALAFFGAISVQHTLPFGTPQDVFDEVKLRMDTIGAGGGYIMAPSHLVSPDIPWDNLVALFEAAERFGGYGRTAESFGVSP